MTYSDDFDPMDKFDEEDAPKERPEEMTEEVREMTPSFKVVDKRRYFDQIKYSPHGRQWLFHESSARFRVAIAGRRMGKALDIETLLPSPDSQSGFTAMKDVCVGDHLFDEFGRITTVEAISDIMYDHDCYELVFNDGTKVVADADHLWLSWTKRYRKSLCTTDRRRRPPEILTTAEMAETLLYGKTRPEYNHAIPVAKPLEYYEKELPVDPYVLGVWLGSRRTMVPRITNNIAEILKNVQEAGYEVSVLGPGSNLMDIPGILTKLKKLDLLDNRYIPTEYLTASVSQRLALLQGLMDTCGHARGTANEFCSTTQELAYSFQRLALSLGLKASSCIGGATPYRASYGGKYRVFVNGELPLYRLARKLKVQLDQPRSNQTRIRSIVSIVRVPTRPVKCIQVDSKSELFLATLSCIPTHNSTMAAKDVQPRLLVPNKRIWIVGPNYEQGEKEFRIIWNDMIVRLGFGQEKKIRKSYNKKMGNMYIEFPWNTRLEVRSAERADTLVGDSLDHVIMSEAALHNKETWERYIRPSLSDKLGSADFPTTPRGMNWLYELWRYGQDPEYAGVFASWRYPAWENQIVFPGGREDSEIKLLERTLPKEEFDQEIAALFTSFSGKIFSEWDEELHVRDFGYNPLWRNYVAFDWGFVNPLAAIEFQIDPMDRVWVWREHYKERIILEDHLELLKHRAQPEGYKINLCFGDAADPGAVQTVSANFAPCWGDPKSKDNWMEGIQLVKSFLKTQQVGVLDEYGTPKYEPWLFVNRSCSNLIREFNNYRSAPRRSTRVELSPREAAQKFDDHALDALRYGLMHIFKLGANVSLSTTVDRNELKSIGEDRGFFTSSDLRF